MLGETLKSVPFGIFLGIFVTANNGKPSLTFFQEGFGTVAKGAEVLVSGKMVVRIE